VFDFTQVNFGKDDAESYEDATTRSASAQFAHAKDKAKLYQNWRTLQISDHFPLWLERKTDFADAYLETVMRGKKSAPH
jgi:hypothetical protein